MPRMRETGHAAGCRAANPFGIQHRLCNLSHLIIRQFRGQNLCEAASHFVKAGNFRLAEAEELAVAAADGLAYQVPQSRRNRTRSASERFIAHRLPAQNEIPFLSAASSLPSATIMGMEMGSAVRNGVLQRHVTLKPLMKIPSLSNVNGNPTTVLGLFGINVNAWQRSKSSVNGMDLIFILVAGLPEPITGGRCALRMGVTAE
jgi:hypothetical protein